MRRLYGVKNVDVDFKRYDNRKYVGKWVDVYSGNPYWLRKYDYEFMKPGNISNTVVDTLVNGVLLQMETEVTGGPRSEYVNKQYQRFIKQSRTAMELLMVQGSLIFKPFIYRDRIGVEIIPATNFIPLKFDDMGELVDVVFIETIEKDNKKYTRLERHNFDPYTGSYMISNTAHLGEGVDSSGKLTMRAPLNIISEWGNLSEELVIESGAKRPLFVYMTTPYSDISSVNSPLGISLIDRIKDDLETYDSMYNDMTWEYEASRLRVDIAESLMIDPSTGERKSNFIGGRVNRHLYNSVTVNPTNISSSIGDQIQTYSPDIRVEKYLLGIQSTLRKIEMGSGLAFGDISENAESAKTATEVIASKNRRISTVKTFQDQSIEPTYRELVKIMFDLVEMYDLVEEKTHEEYLLEFDFSKGIVDELEINKMVNPVSVDE